MTNMKNLFTGSSLQWPDLQWINTDSLIKSKVSMDVPSGKLIFRILSQFQFQFQFHIHQIDEPALHFSGEKLCFLQYTSGSTSQPKGVMITWKALSCNIQTIISSLRASDSTVVVSWLPQYHDMGLIGSLLALLFCGGNGIYISPIHFILNPCIWLLLCTKYKATHIQGPNFAYALVARKLNSFPNSVSINLSSLQHIFNAAEPISVESTKQFISLFKQYGLNPSAMTGGYGLAESCVYVCDEGHGILTFEREMFEKENKIVPVRYYDCITSSIY